MLILACIGGFIGGFLGIAGTAAVASVCANPSTVTNPQACADLQGRLGACGGIMMLAGIMALVGAIFCFMRKNWMIAAICALLATILPGIGPVAMLSGLAISLDTTIFIFGFLIGGGLFGMIGLFLLLAAKPHFKAPGQP
jgi:hypothetical protein